MGSHSEVEGNLRMLGAFALVVTRPVVEGNSPEPVAPLVRVGEVAPDTGQLQVTTHGTVAPWVVLPCG